MKSFKFRIMPILIFLAIMAVLATFLLYFLLSENEKQETREPLSNPVEIYSASVSDARSSIHSYKVILHKSITIENEHFEETRTQEITLGIGSNDILSKEALAIGEHNVSIEETYHNGTVYTTVGGSKFCSSIDYDQVIRRYTPMSLIEPSLYSSVTGYVQSQVRYIEFKEASTPEIWLQDTDIQLDTAEGYVEISADGKLSLSKYTAGYASGSANVSITVTTIPTEKNSDIQIPQDTSCYTKIASPDAPILLEKATGYLMSASSISATYEDYIEYTAFEDHQARTIRIDAVSIPDWSSRTLTTIAYSDHSKTGSDVVLKKEEIFSDGIYTIRIDQNDPMQKESVSVEDIRKECQNTFIGTIMLPSQIAEVQITETSTTIEILYVGNNSFSEQMRTNACNTLYNDSDIFSDQTHNYTVDLATCYLKLDKSTGLPVASGFQYEGTYTVDALPYRLIFSADQQYKLLGDTAQDAIRNAVQQ